MKAKESFDLAITRAKHLVSLYHLLKNKRSREMRSDWARRFKRTMKWPQGDAIDRVDGSHAMLILREKSGLTANNFTHEYLADLLRAALVITISALDHYLHQTLLGLIMKKTREAEKIWNTNFKKLSVPISAVKAAISRAKKKNKGKGTKPMVIIRHALQDQLHYRTFQKSSEIAEGLNQVGIHVWEECKNKLGIEHNLMMDRLNKIAKRRDTIVHECDFVRKRKTKKIIHHKIDALRITEDIEWIHQFVTAIDGVCFPL